MRVEFKVKLSERENTYFAIISNINRYGYSIFKIKVASLFSFDMHLYVYLSNGQKF